VGGRDALGPIPAARNVAQYRRHSCEHTAPIIRSCPSTCLLPRLPLHVAGLVPPARFSGTMWSIT